MNHKRMHQKRSEKLAKAWPQMLAVAVFALSFVWFFRTLEPMVAQPTDPIDETYVPEQSYVYLNGKAYTQKEQLTTLLLLGIDHEGKVEPVQGAVNGRQCDFVTLLVLDRDTNHLTLLQLNRDTMTKVQRLGIDGQVAYDLNAQLATAHAYGSGMEDSCKNAAQAVEDYLYGQDVDHYLSLNMTGLEILVDAMGGVTATIEEDFSQLDPAMVQGKTMLLNGRQAITYLRGRTGIGDQTNVSRQNRQMEFLEEVFGQLQENQERAMEGLSTEAADYLVTDLTANRLSWLLEDFAQAEFQGVVTPEGEAVVGEEYMEFYADEESLRELVIGLFYEPVEESE